jgi:hypothetical protein
MSGSPTITDAGRLWSSHPQRSGRTPLARLTASSLPKPSSAVARTVTRSGVDRGNSAARVKRNSTARVRRLAVATARKMRQMSRTAV